MALSEIAACDIKILDAIDTTSGSIFAYVVQKKGVEEDRYSVDKLVDDVAWLGYSEITLKSDNGPAIVQLLKEVLKSLKVSSVDKAMGEHPAPYDSKGNSAAENAVKQVQGLLRTHKSALERHITKSIPREHPVIAWMVEYVAFLLTTRRVKSNGLTPYQHLRGKQFVHPLLCFGGKCLCKLREKGPQREESSKIESRWKRGISRGFLRKTNEYEIWDFEANGIFTARCVHRLVRGKRFCAEALT